jgi:hypothetical protein
MLSQPEVSRVDIHGEMTLSIYLRLVMSRGNKALLINQRSSQPHCLPSPMHAKFAKEPLRSSANRDGQDLCHCEKLSTVCEVVEDALAS